MVPTAIRAEGALAEGSLAEGSLAEAQRAQRFFSVSAFFASLRETTCVSARDQSRVCKPLSLLSG